MAMAKKKAHDKDDHEMLGSKKIRVVRGGGICSPTDMQPGHEPAVIRNTMQVGQCRPTPGPDPRPRWRVAGKM